MWKLVSPDKDEFTKKVAEDYSGGYFMRILPGAEIVFPLQSCLMITQRNLEQRVHNIIIADNSTACKGAERALRRAGVDARTLTSSAELGARDLGRFLGTVACGMSQKRDGYSHPSSVIIGGESTVQVTGKGTGGRNQELALSGVQSIAGLRGAVVSSLATDGIDGNSPAAGAMIDGNTASRAKKLKLDSNTFLARNDSYNFFRRLNDNLVTGPTGTNVADICVVISDV